MKFDTEHPHKMTSKFTKIAELTDDTLPKDFEEIEKITRVVRKV
jgi:hypothetical protein